MRLTRQEKNIMKKIQRLEKDKLPNFYLTGKSLDVLERVGLQITRTLESEKKLKFKGVVKHFSILMPYLEKREEADDFLRLLEESVSIARDCYDTFCGIVLIECSESWNHYGPSAELYRVLRYIRTLSQAHFIVLLPEEEFGEKAEQMFAGFTSIGLWMKVDCENADVKTCVSSCVNYAEKEGYTISSEVRWALQERLSRRQQNVTDNAEAARLWIQQIIFTRRMEKDPSIEISLADVEQLSCVPVEKPRPASIGFGVKNR